MSLVALVLSTAAVALLVTPRGRLPAPDQPTAARRPRSVPSPLLAGLSAGLTALVLLPMPAAAPAAVVGGLVAARLVGRLEPATVRRRRARLAAALPHVVDLMSTCLLAGGSPASALARLVEALEAPMCDELAPYARRLALGADPVGVWRSMAAHQQLGALGRALLRSAETGASVADALERLATELRAERRAALEAQARTIEVKASLPLGLCLLPAFVLVGIVPMIAGSFSLTFLGQ